MSGGMSAGAFALAAISAGAGVASTAYGIVNGKQQQATQKKALASQNEAQQKAEANALSTERKSEVAQGAANQQTPNIAAILARAAAMGNQGVSSTMLTGPGGVSSGMNLGKTTLLGS